jgi:hypothetical protein
MGVRIAFMVGLAFAGIGLGVGPVVESGPAVAVAGCGAGFYKNSDGDCVPDPSKSSVGGSPSDGTLVTAPGFVGPGVATAPSSGGGTSPGGPPPNATARCRDGDYSYSRHHSGTCSGHGGVGEWLAN